MLPQAEACEYLPRTNMSCLDFLWAELLCLWEPLLFRNSACFWWHALSFAVVYEL